MSEGISLTDAVILGDIERVKRVIEEGADVNKRSFLGETALIKAVERGNADMVKLLIEKGAAINQKNIWDETALMIAAKAGKKNMAKILLDYGAGVDVRNKDQKTALMLATEHNNINIVDMLVRYGVGMDLRDKNKKTALMIAAEKGNTKIVELLEREGAKLELEDENKMTALMFAARSGHEDIVSYLRNKGMDINKKDVLGETALMHAARNGHENVVKYLVKEGASVNEKNGLNETPAFIASENGYINIVKYLVQNKANLEIENASGKTALMVAAENGHTSVADYLVKYGLDINKVDKDGKTALMLASEHGHADTAEYLVKEGAQLNEVDDKRETALMLAAKNGNIEVAKVLIESGADTELKNNEKKTALMLAKGKTKTKIETMIKNFDINKCLIKHAKWNNVEKFAELLGKNVDINTKDTNGMTPLMIAAKNGYRTILELLINRGADTTLLDEEEHMALTYAMHKGYDDIASELLPVLEKDLERKHGEYDDKIDKNGMTGLMRAIKNKRDDQAMYLILTGADLRCTDVTGKNILEYLLENGNVGLLREAIEKKGKTFGYEGDNIIDLTMNENAETVNNFIKNNYISEKSARILTNNGLDVNKIEKDFGVRIKRGQDEKKAVNILRKVFEIDKEVGAKILAKKVEEIDVIPKGEKYKIIVRENKGGRAYKRYMCKFSQNGYEFYELKKKERWLLTKAIRGIKKFIKHACRRMTMKSTTYKEIVSRSKETIEKIKLRTKGEKERLGREKI